MTDIEWTNETFNPWWGCTAVSPGCAHCYAEAFALRGVGIEGGPVRWGRGAVRRRTSEKYWKAPLAWNARAGRRGVRLKVFCASMADVFDVEVEPSWRVDLWDLVRRCRNLDWQILTKRPENIRAMLPPDWGEGWPHVWLGTSVEDQIRANTRIPVLAAIPAAVRFLSAEPLLGPVTLDLRGISWVICGGESGRSARPLDPAWALSVRDQCVANKVPFFFKQWGGKKKKGAGKKLEGRTWRQFPKSPFQQVRRRKLIAAAVGRYAGKNERLPIDRRISEELEKRARLEGISRREYLDRILRQTLGELTAI